MACGSNTGAPMSTVTRPSALMRGSMMPLSGADPRAVALRQAPVAHEAHEAARAIAALLDLAAVGVVDHVFEIDALARRGPHRKHLVGAHAEVAVRQEAVLAGRQVQPCAGLVEHDEVVAGALHLGETDTHGPDYRGSGRRARSSAFMLGAHPSPHPLPCASPTGHPNASRNRKTWSNAILERRGGTLLNLDRALLWSEPLARGWNVYLRNVRTGLSASRKLRELGICTVALLTGAHYEYHHHAPDFLAAGGTQPELDALAAFVAAPAGAVPGGALAGDAALVVQYAAQMTRDVKVDDALFARMRERFDTTELVEITSAIATYNMVARFLVALGVTPEE